MVVGVFLGEGGEERGERSQGPNNHGTKAPRFCPLWQVQSSNQCCPVLLLKKMVFVGFWYYLVILNF
jgi:hypothetical protein